MGRYIGAMCSVVKIVRYCSPFSVFLYLLTADRNGMSGKTGILLDFADRDVDITELQNKIKKLQKDLEEANHLLAQEKKDRKLQMTKLEVQLTAGQKSNNELEKTIAALKLKSVIERDTLNDMHMKTIKVSTST